MTDIIENAFMTLNIIDCPICEYWQILQEEKVCSQCVEKLKDFAITAGMRFDHEPTSL